MMNVEREAVVDLGAITANVAALCELVRGSQVLAAVKADGYGHGMVPAARAALAGGAACGTSACSMVGSSSGPSGRRSRISRSRPSSTGTMSGSNWMPEYFFSSLIAISWLSGVLR